MSTFEPREAGPLGLGEEELTKMAEGMIAMIGGAPSVVVPTTPASVPSTIPATVPPIVGMNGALPRLFEPNLAPGMAPAGDSHPYYFLTPAPKSSPAAVDVRRGFDVHDVRRDFPILGQRVHGRPLIWLDNAATTQKPRAVIERMVRFYSEENSNVHRGAHALAARATDAYEEARAKVRQFLGAGSVEEIVFVRGTTEAINLVAQSWGRRNLGEGDEIVVSTLEHHSNIVPWQLVAAERGAKIRVIPVDDRGEVHLDDFERLLSDRTKLVAITHVSNALGTVLPVAEMTALAHRRGARVLVDGAQAVSHFPVNVQAIDADFYALSGHKLFAPTGIGVLFAKKELLADMPPWQGGGNMIEHVSFEKTTYARPPAKFEAGTGALAQAVGLGAAIDYLQRLGMPVIERHEKELLAYGMAGLGEIKKLRLVGTAREKAGVLSFIPEGISVEEMGRALDRHGIAVRAGHHCAQPTMQRFGTTAMVRPSLAFYNTREELDALFHAVRRILAC